MKIGFVGLGKMGFNMAQHLLECGHDLVLFDLSAVAVASLAEKGGLPAASLEELAGMLQSPRFIWLMVPAGDPVDTTLDTLIPLLQPGDIIIDGGNSHYTDSVKRAARLNDKGIHFLDAGTSGGLEGARQGACMMVGGDKHAYDLVEPLLKDMCVENGYGYMGRSGSGHFAKMVHNGVEYGMMQAIGEGFDLLDSSGYGIIRIW